MRVGSALFPFSDWHQNGADIEAAHLGRGFSSTIYGSKRYTAPEGTSAERRIRETFVVGFGPGSTCIAGLCSYDRTGSASPSEQSGVRPRYLISAHHQPYIRITSTRLCPSTATMSTYPPGSLPVVPMRSSLSLCECVTLWLH